MCWGLIAQELPWGKAPQFLCLHYSPTAGHESIFAQKKLNNKNTDLMYPNRPYKCYRPKNNENNKKKYYNKVQMASSYKILGFGNFIHILLLLDSKQFCFKEL